MRLAHISLTQRFDSQGRFIGKGGVEKFAFFLQRIFPELQIYSWVESGLQSAAPDYEKALLLNHYLLKEGLIDKNTVVIGDGFWVNGLADSVARCISVCHGSYIGMAMEHEKYPWGETYCLDWAVQQEAVWRHPKVEIVAVSKRAAFEIESVYGLKSVVIENAVPLDIYKPTKQNNGLAILHVAVSPRKGNEMVQKMRQRGWVLEQLGYSPTGDLYEEASLWQRGHVLFMPSLYEGASYALIEAMACGLVPVAYATGSAFDLPCWAGEVTDDHHENVYEYLLQRVLDYHKSYFPREYVEEYLDFAYWEKQWRQYLNG